MITASVMALAQYLSNTSVSLRGTRAQGERRFWPTWKTHYLWASITYFGGAAAAAMIFRSFNTVGLYALAGNDPDHFHNLFTYHKYLEDIRLTAAQAEKAERERAGIGTRTRRAGRTSRRRIEPARGRNRIVSAKRWKKTRNTSATQLFMMRLPACLIAPAHRPPKTGDRALKDSARSPVRSSIHRPGSL